jgi:chromosome segregation ATPase
VYHSNIISNHVVSCHHLEIQVAEEREGGMSPRLTRSAKKQTPRPLESPGDNSNINRGLFQMEFSPSDPRQVRKIELQQEKERDERLKQKRLHEGDVYFLSPGAGSAKKKIDVGDNQFCLQLSPEAEIPVGTTNYRPMSRASSINSGITLNSAQVEEMQVHLHELDKENAALKAENRMVNANFNKLQDKFDEANVKWETKSQRYIIDNAKLEGKLQFLESPEVMYSKEWKAMEFRVEGIGQQLGYFKSEQHGKQLDSEHGIRLQEMEREIVRLQQLLAERENIIKSQAEMHKNALNVAKKDLDEHEVLKIEVNECVRNLKEEKDAAMSAAQTAQSQLVDTKSRLAELQQHTEEIKSNLGAIGQEQIDDLDKQIADVQRTLVQTEVKCAELDNEIIISKDKLGTSEGKNLKLESEMAKVLDENQACKDELVMLTSKLESFETKIQALTNKVVKTKSEVRESFILQARKMQ